MSTIKNTALRGGLGVSFCAGRTHFTGVDQLGRPKSASGRATSVSAAIEEAIGRVGYTPTAVGVSYHGNSSDVTLRKGLLDDAKLKLVEPVAASQHGAGIVPLFQGSDAAATPLVRATSSSSAEGKPTFIKVGPDGMFAWIDPDGEIHSMQTRVLAPLGSPQYPFLGQTGMQLGAINPFHLIGNAAWARMAAWLVGEGPFAVDDVTAAHLKTASMSPTPENLRTIASRLIHLAMHRGEEAHELGFTIAGHMAVMIARMLKEVINQTGGNSPILLQSNTIAGVQHFGDWMANAHNTGFMASLGDGPLPRVDLVHMQRPGTLESIGALGMARELIAA